MSRVCQWREPPPPARHIPSNVIHFSCFNSLQKNIIPISACFVHSQALHMQENPYHLPNHPGNRPYPHLHRWHLRSTTFITTITTSINQGVFPVEQLLKIPFPKAVLFVDQLSKSYFSITDFSVVKILKHFNITKDYFYTFWHFSIIVHMFLYINNLFTRYTRFFNFFILLKFGIWMFRY